jgi:hypothetical protein
VQYSLRLNDAQHRALRSHLFPGDGLEAVALIVCGRRSGDSRHVFCAHRIVPIPYAECQRAHDRITWPTDIVDSLIAEMHGKGQALVKVHSHPGGYRKFSRTDDDSDRSLFASISSLLDDDRPHASVIMLPDGEMFGRVLNDGHITDDLSRIIAIGPDLRIWDRREVRLESFALRHAQAFGSGTTGILRGLSVAIVGCSGTGSIVVEQLTRLGVGRLILVDPDFVEEKNLNRILNSCKEDAYLKRPKVHALASAIARAGIGQEVLAIQSNLATTEAVESVAECDLAFGCMDGVEGRHLLNRVATFYQMPYFDVGVRLDADGRGGIENISGAVHFLQPGSSSLHSRGVYSLEEIRAESMRRTNPAMYEQQLGEGYLRGVVEDRPAVISVNMFFASLVVNEFLARLHPYRNRENSEFAYVGGSLAEMQFYPEPESGNCPLLSPHVGRGDVEPLLDRPGL